MKKSTKKKSLYPLVLLFPLFLFIASCDDSSSHTNIALAYTKAVMNYQYKESASYATSDVQTTYTECAEKVDKTAAPDMLKMVRAIMKDAEFSVAQKNIRGDTAEITISIQQRGSTFFDHHVSLVKENGAWKVNQSAELIEYEVSFNKEYGMFLKEISQK